MDGTYKKSFELIPHGKNVEETRGDRLCTIAVVVE